MKGFMKGVIIGFILALLSFATVFFDVFDVPILREINLYKDIQSNLWFTFFSWQCESFISGGPGAESGMTCIVLIPIIVLCEFGLAGGILGSLLLRKS